MKGEFFKGNFFDVCCQLEKEAERNKGKSVGQWLSERKKIRDKVNRAVNRQLHQLFDQEGD